MDKIYLSKEGYQKYLEELENIKKKIEKNNIDITEYVSDDAYGDGWHDNFAYEEARRYEYQLFLEYENKLKGLNEIEIIERDDSDKIGIEDIVLVELTFSDNEIEREVYAQKIASEYQISKEAIYAEINKLENSAASNKKILEKSKPKLQVKEQTKLEEQIIRREKLIIYLLINYPEDSYKKIKNVIKINDIKDAKNQEIIKKLYEEFEKGNINTSHVLDWFEEEEIINEISWILAYDFEITEVNKCIEDILNIYEKEKVIQERNDIIKQLECEGLSQEQINILENRLNEIIIQLAKMK